MNPYISLFSLISLFWGSEWRKKRGTNWRLFSEASMTTRTPLSSGAQWMSKVRVDWLHHSRWLGSLLIGSRAWTDWLLRHHLEAHGHWDSSKESQEQCLLDCPGVPWWNPAHLGQLQEIQRRGISTSTLHSLTAFWSWEQPIYLLADRLEKYAKRVIKNQFGNALPQTNSLKTREDPNFDEDE